MNVFIEVVTELCCIPGFPFRLGVVLSIAIILGLLLYEDARSTWKWFLILLIYVAFQDWLALLALKTVAHDLYRPLMVSLIGFVLFSCGLAVGALIARHFNNTSRALDDNAIKAVVQHSVDAVNGANG